MCTAQRNKDVIEDKRLIYKKEAGNYENKRFQIFLSLNSNCGRADPIDDREIVIMVGLTMVKDTLKKQKNIS